MNLPTGFAYVAGSSALGSSHVADPTGTSTLGWTLSLPTGTSTLSFQANAGIGLGPATATVSAAIGGDVESTSTATVEVIDGEAPEINSASPAFPLVPGTPPANDGNLNIGYLTYQGDLNDWSVTVPQNDELTIALTNLPATYDLELFGPASQQLQGTPTEDLPGVTDTLPSTSPEGTTEATPAPRTCPSRRRRVTSSRRCRTTPTARSQYIQTPPLAAGTYTVQVSGYNGAFSTQPYLLQANLLGGGPPRPRQRALLRERDRLPEHPRRRRQRAGDDPERLHDHHPGRQPGPDRAEHALHPRHPAPRRPPSAATRPRS